MINRNELGTIIVATASSGRFRAIQDARPAQTVRQLQAPFNEDRQKQEFGWGSLDPEIVKGDSIEYTSKLAEEKVSSTFKSLRRARQISSLFRKNGHFYIVAGDSVQAIIPEGQEHTWEGQTTILEKPPSLIEYISRGYYELQSGKKVSIVTSLAGMEVNSESMKNSQQPEIFRASTISEFRALPFTRDDFIKWLRSDPHHNVNGCKNSAGGIPLLRANLFNLQDRLEVYLSTSEEPPQQIFVTDRLGKADRTILMHCVYGTFPQTMNFMFNKTGNIVD